MYIDSQWGETAFAPPPLSIDSPLDNLFIFYVYRYESHIYYFPEPDMPDHDLEPPRFSRRAFERLLNDWPAVKGMIMSGKINVLLSSSKIRKVSSSLF